MNRHRHLDRLMETAWRERHVEHIGPATSSPNRGIENYPHDHEDSQFSSHHAKLNEDHRSSIMRYKMDSQPVNRPLRKGEGLNNTAAFDKKNLDHVTAHPLTQALTVHRGYMGFEPEKDFPPGHEFTDHGFAGTSIEPRVAKRFTMGGHTFQIHLKPGDHAHHLDEGMSVERQKRSEQEVLLPRSTRFRVHSHSHDEDGNTQIHLHVVHQPGVSK